MDWEDPKSPTIKLALARVKATKPEQRIGSLLFNPGGPGQSGKQYLPSLLSMVGEQVQERYDLVGFDPRGVGESTPVTCFTTTEERDAYYAAGWPSTPEGFEQSVEVFKPFVEACKKNTGPVLGHVDTVSAAKDLDLLRDLLGDKQLNYLGYSYGTKLGATYAELFPKNVGRMVLDGAIDPSKPADQQEIEQAAGFQSALETYVADCLVSATCPFTGTKEDALRQINQLLVSLETQPISAGADDPRKLTQSLALNGILVAMYADETWPLESMALASALEQRDGSGLMMLSDLYLDRVNGKYKGNLMEAFQAINCLDGAPPSDFASAEAHAAALKAAAPTFGEFWGYGEKLCELWPYKSVSEPHPIAAPGSGPIVVVGTTGDPATPYHGAVALAEQLESGTLITYTGEGHTAYGRSNQCVDGAIDAYFLEGTAPPANLTC
jgi:pimeloyl-ACP methyl ester carboxylesterase